MRICAASKQNLYLYIKNGITSTNLVSTNYGVHTVVCVVFAVGVSVVFKYIFLQWRFGFVIKQCSVLFL